MERDREAVLTAEDWAFVWKWIERAAFDRRLTAQECIVTLAHYPNAPWKLGRWDVDHKPYAAAFYETFPKAASSETGDTPIPPVETERD